jgi:hypothetical protein
MQKIIATAALAALTGCGVSITATKITEDKAAFRDEGVYYSLPLTQVHVAVPVVLEVFAKGRVGEVYEKCLQACTANPPANACELPKPATVFILRPEVALSGIPDPANRYRVTVDAETFASAQHKMAFNPVGVVTSAQSSASDTSYEIAAGVLRSVTDMVAAFAGLQASVDAAKISMVLPRDAAPAKPVDQIECGEVRKIRDELKGREDKITALKQRIEDTLKAKGDGEFAGVVVGYVKELIAGEQAELAAYRMKADLEEVKKTYRYRLEAGALQPAEFTALPSGELKFKQEAAVDEAQARAPDIWKVLNTLEYKFHAGIERPDGFAKCADPDCGIPATAGFRYRIPRTGKLVVTVTQGTNAALTLLSTSIPIAQYGPIATLPSRFEGKGGSVEFTGSDITGSLLTVNIGAEAAPATAITGPIDSVADAAVARRQRKEKKAQAEADAPKNDLQREKDLLQLQKEIRDLKKDLGV